MTKIARASTQPRPVIESWNACAVPWKLPEIVAGRVSAATDWTRATASPSATPGCRLNDKVTEGSWPVWFTDSGPTVPFVLTTVESGTRLPAGVVRWSSERAVGSRW